MINELKIFDSSDFGEVRVITDSSDEPWFCLSDVCKALDLDSSQVRRRLDDGVCSKHPLATEGGIQSANFVNEDGLYDVIFDSRKPAAKKFRKWVTSEVLPSIRRTGGYIAASDSDSEADIMARAYLIAQQTLQRREMRIAQQQTAIERQSATIAEQGAVIAEQTRAIEMLRPKAEYYDSILHNPTTVLVTQIAQDYGMSARRFNRLLKELGIQYKRGRQWILRAKYVAEGYVSSHTESGTGRNGKAWVKMHTCWTQKGRLFLYDTLKEVGHLPLVEKV